MNESTNQPVENISKPLSSNKKWFILGLIFILLLLCGIVVFLIYQNFSLQQKLAKLSIPSSTSPSAVVTPAQALLPTQIPPLTKEPELVSLDNFWNQYTNYKLGFSLKIPKQTTGATPCKWHTENGDHSYRPESGIVPIKIFEYEEGVYIDHEYTYKLTGETKECDSQGACRYYFSGCEKIITTLKGLQKEKQTWNIVNEKVTNDQELELFIKRYFQPACKLGQKKPTSQTGVFDVSVKGDGLDPEQSKCFLNYMYVLKYAPEKNRVVSWDIGQSTKFFIEKNGNYEHYDNEMLASFKFL